MKEENADLIASLQDQLNEIQDQINSLQEVEDVEYVDDEMVEEFADEEPMELTDEEKEVDGGIAQYIPVRLPRNGSYKTVWDWFSTAQRVGYTRNISGVVYAQVVGKHFTKFTRISSKKGTFTYWIDGHNYYKITCP